MAINDNPIYLNWVEWVMIGILIIWFALSLFCKLVPYCPKILRLI